MSTSNINISQNIDDIFFGNSDLNNQFLQNNVNENLLCCDEGELFLENSKTEFIEIENGIVKSKNFSVDNGFGYRGTAGDVIAYSYSDILSKDKILQANNTIKSILYNDNKSKKININPTQKTHNLYQSNNPIDELEFSYKLNQLLEIDKYIRARESNVKHILITLINNYQVVKIFRPNNEPVSDYRPLVRINIVVMVEKNNMVERGSVSWGGRYSNNQILSKEIWQEKADRALKNAYVNLEAKPCDAGLMPVVLGNGWPGVLLHEAVGHGLEGDFNRKKTSVYSDMIGQRIAAKGVKIVDNGTIMDRRGSLNIDDEGTCTQENVLIEDGILKNYMQDKMNARLMNVEPTGNGRRESYKFAPMPRMTNTYMENGQYHPMEIIESVENGIYAVNFNGGQVDITSGQFVFAASEAYKIINGKIAYPVKGATIIGSGFEVMHNISMIANDTRLDEGSGTCGKDGQSIPVGVGQPTLLIDQITVGGTKSHG